MTHNMPFNISFPESYTPTEMRICMRFFPSIESETLETNDISTQTDTTPPSKLSGPSKPQPSMSKRTATTSKTTQPMNVFRGASFSPPPPMRIPTSSSSENITRGNSKRGWSDINTAPDSYSNDSGCPPSPDLCMNSNLRRTLTTGWKAPFDLPEWKGQCPCYYCRQVDSERQSGQEA